MHSLAKVITGSRLYGTATAESDTDYRGIYLPTKAECLLGRVRDTIEDKSEEDTTYYSLQTFLRLASEGQSVAIEMLAAPPECVVASSPVWERLRTTRHLFFTRNMYAFLGYAKSMAGKYSTRADRLAETEAILKLFTDGLYRPDQLDSVRLSALWDHLPISLNAVKTTNDRSSAADKRAYQVCGREIQATVTVAHAYSVIKGIHDSYGERVRAAKEGRIDWKAFMHAFRVALQAKEIVETGDLCFPLRDAAWLRDVRMGRLDFMAEGLDKRLDDLIAEVQAKLDASSLPAKVDGAAVDALLLAAYDEVGS